MPRQPRSELGMFEGNMKYVFPADVRRFLIEYHNSVGRNQTPQQSLYELIRMAAADVGQNGVNHHIRRQVLNKARSTVMGGFLQAFKMIEADLLHQVDEESNPSEIGENDTDEGQTEFLEPGDGNDEFR